MIIEVNAAWLRFAADNGGLAADTGIGSNYLAACAATTGPGSDSAATARAGLAAVLAGRQDNFALEYPCHAADRQRWFLMSVTRLATACPGALVMHAEISPQRAGESTQAVGEQRLQLALEATGDGLWDWDLRSGIAYLSPGYYALTGYRPEEVTADLHFLQRLVHPDDWPRVLDSLESHRRGETPFAEVEYRMLTAAGEQRWIRGRGCVVERAADGSAARMIGHITDITSHRHIGQALRDSEARYRAVVEAQTDLISRVAIDGTILFANEIYCHFFGLRADELIGRKWHPIVHPDDIEMIEARLAELSPQNPSVLIENRVLAGDGEARWMQWVNRGIFDAQGRITEIQCVGRDIDRRKQLELQQLALLDENTRLGRELIRLQEQERAALARELHDELSQQLTAIRAYAGAIGRRSRGAGNPTRQDAAAIAAAAADIYTISHRMMEGLHPQLLDSAGLAAALQARLANLPATGTRVWLRLAGNLDTTDGQVRIHLFRVVQEALANVLRHARARRVRIFLGERRRPGQRWLRLVVRDDGIGMDTTAPSAGYGLIVMRERVRNIGGSLVVSSRPGQGVRIAANVPLGD